MLIENISINVSRAAWSASNWSGNCPVYRDVYLKAYDAVKGQLGNYIMFFAIAVVIQAILFRLWERQKVSDKRFGWAMTIIIGAEMMWIFTLLGLYFLKV